MLQNARVTAFTFSELLRENQQAGKIAPPPLSTQIRVKVHFDVLSAKFPFILNTMILFKSKLEQNN